MVEFRVLGPLEVLVDGQPVHIGGNQPRLLLAALLAQVNEVVSSDALADILWGEQPPDSAQSTLQKLVHRLRKALDSAGAGGDEEPKLLTRPPGYLLRVHPHSLDAAQFADLVALAHHKVSEGQLQESVQILDEALVLWRGPAWAEFSDQDFARPEIARLEGLRAAAIDERTEIRLVSGQHAELIGELEAAVTRHPLRERPRAQLMLALHRSGRQAEALRIYQDFRHYLVEEVGLEPSRALQRLEAAVVAQEPALDQTGTRENHAGFELTTREEPPVSSVTAALNDRVTVGTVTVLVASLERLGPSSRLGAESAVDPRQKHFFALRQAIAEAEVEEVKDLGDGLRVVFPSASVALTCAVHMQQRVDVENRGSNTPSRLRVGLAAGEVRWEHGGCTGEPVVEASRLSDSAEGGQILATEFVRALAARRARHSFSTLGELRLEGLPPLATLEIAWEPEGKIASGEVPLPSRLSDVPAVGVVGRHAELASIASAREAVSSGDGRQVVLVAGEAGVGKTTLVAEAARTAFAEGSWVGFGHCEEDLPRPYQVVSEALSHLVAHAPESMLLDHVAEHGSELARLVPALARRLPELPPSRGTDAEAERYLVFASAVGLISSAVRNQTVLLVLEDLQWADKASLQLLSHLVASSREMSLVVLATFRDTELPRAPDLMDTLAALRRESGVTDIPLSGLEDSEVITFMESAAGHRLDADGLALAKALYEETDGNPFFVGEVLRHLVDSGAISRNHSGRWTPKQPLGQLSLPPSVRQVIRSRLHGLGKGAEQILSLAAVVGFDFDLELLSGMSGRSESDLLDLLDAAAAAALVREHEGAPGRYCFRHALIQHTLCQDLGPTREALAHRRVAEALEAICGNRPGARVPELARHWSLAQPADDEKALGYLRQAGEAALNAMAPDQAIGYLVRAMNICAELAREPSIRIDLLITLGTAQRQAGHATFRETLLEAAHQAMALGDTQRLVAAALANHRVWGYAALGVFDNEKVTVLEEALAQMPAGDSLERARLLATLCAELDFGSPITSREALACEAQAMAHRLADPTTIVQFSYLVDLALDVPKALEERLDHTSEAMELAVAIEDPVLFFFAALSRSVCTHQAGLVDELDHCLGVMESLSKRLGQPLLVGLTQIRLAGRELLSGNPLDAERLAVQALEVANDAGQSDAIAAYGAQLMIARYQQGKVAELTDVLAQTAAANPDVAAYRAALAVAQMEAGREADAMLLMEEPASRDFECVPENGVWLTTMVIYSIVATQLSAIGAAGKLYARLRPWDSQIVGSGVTSQGPVAHYLGGLASVLGRYHDAEACFTKSLELSERTGAKFFSASTRLDWGRMLIRRRASGDLLKARELLTNAHAAATANGYASVAANATRALAKV